MNKIKYGKYKLNMVLSNYLHNNNLYIGLITGSGESFADLTINIPNYLFELDNEIVINGDIPNDLINVLEDLGILIDTYKFAYSGYGQYKVMYFNYDVAKDYISCDNRGLDLPF